ncbi:MAG: two-component sensor histidine kinase [Hyphomicrobium sp.]|nr:MAG: two-component sensor histidine kinase [Hyphomicrobium sp.]
MTALFERLRKAAATTAFRLSAVAVTAFVLAAGVIGALLFWQTNSVLTEQVLSTLRGEAVLLKKQAVDNGPVALAESIKELARPDSRGLYFLVSPGGVKLAGNLDRVPPELANSPTGGVFRVRGEPGTPTAKDSGRLAVAIPVDVGDGVYLWVGRDIEDQRLYADKIKRTFLIGFGLLSLLGLMVGLAVSRLFLTRMDAITSTSRSIMAGDLTRRVPIDGSGGELDNLAQNLNDMLDRIEGLMNGLREVSDNIAHDLKTPLNRLRNSAEAALRDPRGKDAYREGLERTIEKSDELIKTFNALLLIARLEAGPLEDSLEEFDLGSFVADVADLYMPAAEEAGFILTIETVTGVVVRANRQLIGQATANLIDNAIKYARGGQPGSAITVRAGPAESGAEISVSDRGPGISAADRARVLKRFVRLEESRTQPGTGLGLSLVAAVARLHHGSVRLEDNEPGLRVVLELSERVIVRAPTKTRDDMAAIAAS